MKRKIYLRKVKHGGCNDCFFEPEKQNIGKYGIKTKYVCYRMPCLDYEQNCIYKLIKIEEVK